MSTDVPALTDLLDSTFGDLPRTGEAALAVDLTHADGTISVTVEDRIYYRGGDPGRAVAHLASAVNREVVMATDDLVLVHAGAVERGGRAVVLPAGPGAGKSTLVAGLVQRGWRAVSDEVVAVEPRTGRLRPYPRPIGLKRGSWAVLPGLRPRVEPEVEPYLAEQWLVAPSQVRAGGAAGSCRPALVVVPRYRADYPTSSRPLPAARALEATVASCHNLDRWGRAGFAALARLAGAAPGHRLEMGSLEAACDEVDRLAAEAGVPG